MTPYQKGLLITGFGGMVLTIDIPLIRLGGGDEWSAQFTRSGLGLAVALLCWIFLSLRKGKSVSLLPGRAGIIVAGCYGLSAIAFVAAVFNTTTANLVFILTSTTIFSALLGWVLLRERPKPATLITMAIMVFAVFLIVSESIQSGNYFGDLCAVAASFGLSLGIVFARMSGKDMGFAPMIGGILPTILAAGILLSKGGVSAFHLDAPWWTIANGVIIIPIAFWCLATGPKYLSGPEVAMFYLLETVLAPIWVWMIFLEVPTRNTLIGGTILICALIGHSLWQLRSERKKRLAQRNELAADVS
ncbi:DMT family transporter [Ahrensia marina]|uniref:Membrane protein n=1 Tax=Ahrensia marina TaxID=1514904 RepID=A0A0M9GN18_9HYPH|nr:DMT family transporter [Ahrensia marina]KPB01747.1 membrane protein [Ahrensia marina]